MNVAELAKIYGSQSLVFMIPMQPIRDMGFVSFTCSDDEYVLQECTLVDGIYNRNVVDGYKCVLKSKDPRFGAREFYVSDLNSLIRRSRNSDFTVRVLMEEERQFAV